MEMQYFKEYSPALGREMECKVYGHGGRPMLYIPCQDGRFFDFEDFHLADTLAPWIESGQLMVMSIDTLDKETWSDTNGDPYWRIRRYEQWLHYIVTPPESESFQSLPDDMIKKYKEQFKYPERFSKEVGGNIVAEPFKPKSKDYER